MVQVATCMCENWTFVAQFVGNTTYLCISVARKMCNTKIITFLLLC